MSRSKWVWIGGHAQSEPNYPPKSAPRGSVTKAAHKIKSSSRPLPLSVSDECPGASCTAIKGVAGRLWSSRLRLAGCAAFALGSVSGCPTVIEPHRQLCSRCSARGSDPCIEWKYFAASPSPFCAPWDLVRRDQPRIVERRMACRCSSRSSSPRASTASRYFALILRSSRLIAG